NAEKALVEFRWEEAENDFYELVLENLSSAHITRIKTSSNVAEILLDKNTPYRWYIVSNVQLSDNTAESEHWKFYTAGDGVSNYAPFPADLISPEQGTNFSKEIQQVTLEWESSDIDDEH